MIFKLEFDDISAVVLSLGESTTDDAIASLGRQTVLPSHTIIVRNTVPFHRALNTGVERTKTPFFVQVDADMILDERCIEILRTNMRSDVGIVIGRLRDPMIGQVIGIKLFRRECFNGIRFRDSVSPDTDFVNDIAQAGWKTIYVHEVNGDDLGPNPTLGEHRPDYSVDYTYLKFLVEGCRYRYRDTFGAFRGQLSRLAKSSHSSALIAQIAFARGMFLEPEGDLLGRSHHHDEVRRLNRFLSSGDGAASLESDTFDLAADTSPNERFRHYYLVGFRLFRGNEIATFRSLMSRLNASGDPSAWISKVGCCKGLFEPDAEESTVAAAYKILRKFARWPLDTPHLFDRSLEAIGAYAAEIGLKSFVIDGAEAAEYRAKDVTLGANYQKTERLVSTSARSDRPSIILPRRLRGHLVCTEPKNLESLRWCFDLLRAGYLSIHVPTYLGPRRIRVLPQILSNAGTRLLPQRAARRPVADTSVKANWALKRLARRTAPKYEPERNRILLVAGDLGRGGSERQMLAVASGLLRRGYQVRLVVLNQTEPDQPNFEQDFRSIGLVPREASDFDDDLHVGFKLTAGVDQAADLSQLRPGVALEIIRLMTAIRIFRPQIVHAWLDHAGLSAGLAATSLGTPSVIVALRSMSPRSFSRQIRLREYFRHGFQAIARNPSAVLTNNSASGARDYEGWLRLRPGSIQIVHNGLRANSVRVPSEEERSAFRSALKVPSNVPVVGSIMRFTEEKDPELWLEVASEVLRIAPQVHFIMAGYGELLESCKARAQAMGLEGRIAFSGATEEAGLVYALFDVFLLTSRVEGLPNVLIEAQAAGCPVVTTDVGGAGEALIDGATGRLVRERSPQCLARAVVEVLFDESSRDRVKQQGADLVASRFGFERMIDRTLEIYQMPLRGWASG